MKYCLVVNGKIVEGPCKLPTNSENISGFCFLSDEELKKYGWLPYTLIDNKGVDQIFVNNDIQILENEIIETKIYRDMTQLEIQEREDRIIENKWKSIRNKRNRLLKECDWTQLNDSPVDKILWATYREELRNIPQTYNDPNSVVWPTLPIN